MDEQINQQMENKEQAFPEADLVHSVYTINVQLNHSLFVK